MHTELFLLSSLAGGLSDAPAGRSVRLSGVVASRQPFLSNAPSDASNGGFRVEANLDSEHV
ncbi:MAG: hypothetical protein RugAbin2_00200 [Rugosibacter sp.]|jgi:hypothetical protein|nr:hypothetical protein [Rugosibacter sp.]